MERQIKNVKKQFLLLAITIILGVSCQLNLSGDDTPQTQEIEGNQTNSSPFAPAESDIPSTFSETPLPDQPIPEEIWPTLPASPQNFPIPTYIDLSPAPTLAVDAAKAKLIEWLEGNPACRLPCWAGIIPGKTTLEETFEIMSAVVDVSILAEGGKCVFGDCWVLGWADHEELVPSQISGSIMGKMDHIVYALDIGNESPINAYRIQKIFSDYGPPDKVFILSGKTGFGDLYPFQVIMIYPQNQFIIHYWWDSRIQGDDIIGCSPHEKIYLSIGFGNPADWTDERINIITNKISSEEGSNILFQNLEEVSDLTIQSFYDSVLNNEIACISTPIDSWP